MAGIFIDVEVAEDARADAELARKLEEACRVDIFAANDGGVEIVERNLDECILCEPVRAVPPAPCAWSSSTTARASLASCRAWPIRQPVAEGSTRQCQRGPGVIEVDQAAVPGAAPPARPVAQALWPFPPLSEVAERGMYLQLGEDQPGAVAEPRRPAGLRAPSRASTRTPRRRCRLRPHCVGILTLASRNTTSPVTSWRLVSTPATPTYPAWSSSRRARPIDSGTGAHAHSEAAPKPADAGAACDSRTRRIAPVLGPDEDRLLDAVVPTGHVLADYQLQPGLEAGRAPAQQIAGILDEAHPLVAEQRAPFVRQGRLDDARKPDLLRLPRATPRPCRWTPTWDGEPRPGRRSRSRSACSSGAGGRSRCPRTSAPGSRAHGLSRKEFTREIGSGQHRTAPERADALEPGVAALR